MSKPDYWEEMIAIAAEECCLALTDVQLKYLAGAAESSHDNYGMAFYSPPASDRISAIESEWKKKYESLQKELDKYRENAEYAMKVALRRSTNDSVSIGDYGEVTLYNGRTVRLQ